MEHKVYLVGAGAGDPELISVKGLKLIQQADIIVHDRLLNHSLLTHRKPSCKVINAGKRPDHHRMTQKEINACLEKAYETYPLVVRLKGGDPYVFGRGGEEGIYLHKKNIPFEVVPGITSAIAGLTYAGIPITQRNIAGDFHVFTGHFKKGSTQTLDFQTMAALSGTLVILMGIGNLEKITRRLIQENKPKDTPAAIIQWGCYSKQKVLTGTLETIYQKAKDAQLKPPGLIVIGEVVSLRKQLNFFEKKPLFNQRVGITRPIAQNDSLVNAVRSMAGEPVVVPSIEIEPTKEEMVQEKIHTVSFYDWVIFTSKNAVDVFIKELFKSKKDLRAFGGVKIAVVGDATRKHLEKYGLRADLQPEKFTGKALAKILVRKLKGREKVLLPRSQKGRPFLAEILQENCHLDEIHLYTIKKPLIDPTLLKRPVDYLLFTSPSTVKNFYTRVHRSYFDQVKIISIGPTTSQCIKAHELKLYKEATEHTIQGIIKCLRGEKNEA